MKPQFNWKRDAQAAYPGVKAVRPFSFAYYGKSVLIVPDCDPNMVIVIEGRDLAKLAMVMPDSADYMLPKPK